MIFFHEHVYIDHEAFNLFNVDLLFKMKDDLGDVLFREIIVLYKPKPSYFRQVSSLFKKLKLTENTGNKNNPLLQISYYSSLHTYMKEQKGDDAKFT